MDEHEKERKRVTEAWDRVARGWARHWPVFESGARGLSERMVTLAGLEPGGCVLDLATGIGEPALTAAPLVGPAGCVVAVDQAPAMVALAAARAREAGHGHVEARCSSAEAFTWEGSPFDAALCRWGLMLFADPDAALAAVRRALRPGGRLVAAVWAGRERMPMIGLLDEAVQAAFGPPEPEPGRPGPFSMADEEALVTRIRGAGFDDVRSERVVCSFTFDSPAHYRAFEEEVSMTLVAAAEERPEVEIAAAGRALEKGAARFLDEDGRVVLPCEAIVVSGMRG